MGPISTNVLIIVLSVLLCGEEIACASSKNDSRTVGLYKLIKRGLVNLPPNNISLDTLEKVTVGTPCTPVAEPGMDNDECMKNTIQVSVFEVPVGTPPMNGITSFLGFALQCVPDNNDPNASTGKCGCVETGAIPMDNFFGGRGKDRKVCLRQNLKSTRDDRQECISQWECAQGQSCVFGCTEDDMACASGQNFYKICSRSSPLLFLSLSNLLPLTAVIFKNILA